MCREAEEVDHQHDHGEGDAHAPEDVGGEEGEELVGRVGEDGSDDAAGGGGHDGADDGEEPGSCYCF